MDIGVCFLCTKWQIEFLFTQVFRTIGPDSIDECRLHHQSSPSCFRMLNSEALRAVPLDAYAYRAIGISAFGSDGLVEQIDLITRATYSASTATTATSRSPLNALMRLYISTAPSTTSRTCSGESRHGDTRA